MVVGGGVDGRSEESEEVDRGEDGVGVDAEEPGEKGGGGRGGGTEEVEREEGEDLGVVEDEVVGEVEVYEGL